MSVDILGTICDQYLSMVQCCFTSTETVRLIRTESPGLSTFIQLLNSPRGFGGRVIKFSLPGLSLSESTNKGVNQRSKHVTQVQQQRPESPTIPLTWHACKGNVIGGEKVLFVGASVPLSALKFYSLRQ